MIKLKDILTEAPNVDKTIGKWAFTGEPKKETPNSIWMGTDLTKDDALDLYNKLKQLQGGEEEADTTEEEKLLKLLLSWTNESDPMLADLLYSKLPTIKAAAAKFPKIFGNGLASGTPIYRGISKFNNSLIDKCLTVESFDVSKWKVIENISTVNGIEPYRYQYTTPVNYSPHLKIQSWTSVLSTAENFEQTSVFSYGDDNKFLGATSGILMTQVNNAEFFFSPEFMTLVWQAHGSVSNENEVIHFGTKYTTPIYLTIAENAYTKLKNAKLKQNYQNYLKQRNND